MADVGVPVTSPADVVVAAVVADAEGDDGAVPEECPPHAGVLGEMVDLGEAALVLLVMNGLVCE